MYSPPTHTIEALLKILDTQVPKQRIKNLSFCVADPDTQHSKEQRASSSSRVKKVSPSHVHWSWHAFVISLFSKMVDLAITPIDSKQEAAGGAIISHACSSLFGSVKSNQTRKKGEGDESDSSNGNGELFRIRHLVRVSEEGKKSRIAKSEVRTRINRIQPRHLPPATTKPIIDLHSRREKILGFGIAGQLVPFLFANIDVRPRLECSGSHKRRASCRHRSGQRRKRLRQSAQQGSNDKGKELHDDQYVL